MPAHQDDCKDEPSCLPHASTLLCRAWRYVDLNRGRSVAVPLSATAESVVRWLPSLPWLKGPFGRGFDGTGFDVVILAVADAEIARAAGALQVGPLVGHCAGSLGLEVLSPHEAFGLHPLMTVIGDSAQFAGAAVAVAGSTPRALGAAHALAEALGMDAFEIADIDRAAYHAAGVDRVELPRHVGGRRRDHVAHDRCRPQDLVALDTRDGRELGGDRAPPER